MTRYRKKPVTVNARQWDGTNEGATSILNWIDRSGGTARYHCSDVARCHQNAGDCPHWIAIDTLEGTMYASLDDYVICGVKNEFYPCRPDIFEATYEEV